MIEPESTTLVEEPISAAANTASNLILTDTRTTLRTGEAPKPVAAALNPDAPDTTTPPIFETDVTLELYQL